MFTACHADQKPVALRAISLFVIFVFLFTQSDVQLVSAYSVPHVPQVDLPAADSGDLDKINYMQDFENLQQSVKDQTQSPLTKVAAGQEEQPIPLAPQLSDETTPDFTTNFLSQINPLLDSESKGEPTVETDNDVVTYRYPDNTHFSYQNSTGEIIEICDFTKAVTNETTGETEYVLETRQFDYSVSGKVTVTTLATGEAEDAYQTFSLEDDGSLGVLLESGYVISGELLESGYVISDTNGRTRVRMREYGDDRMIVYNNVTETVGGVSTKFLIVQEYEKARDSGDYRLVRYTKGSANEDGLMLYQMDLEIRYDDDAGTLTVFDRNPNAQEGNRSFWEYALEPGHVLGDLLAIGEMDLEKNTKIYRIGYGEGTYTMTRADDPKYILVFERLANDGFGRILRYRNSEHDVEFRYERDSETGTETVTILNYANNTFIKMGFVPGASPAEDASGLLDSPENIVNAGTFTLVGTVPTYKNILTRSGSEWIVEDPEDGRIFDVYSSFPSAEWGGLIRSRGPPEADATTFADYRYEYDRANHTVTVYDVTNLRYAVYDWKNPDTPRLLERGSIVLDGAGNVSEKNPVVAYDVDVLGPVTVPATDYDTKSAYDAVLDVLRSRLDLESLDSSDIQDIYISFSTSDSLILTVVVKYKDVQYFYTYTSGISGAVLQKIRLPDDDGTFSITEYDELGRKIRESRESTDPETGNIVITISKEYRYLTEGEIITINRTNLTITVSRLLDDGTVGQTLKTGFYGGQNANGPCYSLGEVGTDPASWN
ncbi:MAG TPA: hypothetical protein PLK73_05000, partial [Candidatus Omnitrophota bacterium]|nr:hypothetical protein [Candidatus Omnitrophota bacterium]